MSDGVAHNRPGHKVPPQQLIAVDVAHFQGQPVAAVLAETRAEAEDAAELIEIEWQELPALLDGETALHSAPIHRVAQPTTSPTSTTSRPAIPTARSRAADHVIEQTFNFHRQTGLSLEPRGLIADFDPGGETLTVYHSHQSPYQMQGVFSRQLGIPEHKVRVIAPDVGGGFGMKINVYAEEVAVAVISMMIGRPVKYCADRLESFVSDNHVRDHKIKARIAFKADGKITAMSVDDISVDRRLRHADAVQHHRKHDAGDQYRRGLRLSELPGAHPQCLRQQAADRHVSRRRHSALDHRQRNA